MFEQILSLPIEKKIGQLFFIGLHGAELGADNRALFDEISPGGVSLYSRNIKNAGQVRRFLEDIRAASIIEPLLSIDEEGGVVDRLRRILTPMPAAASIKTAAEAIRLAEITSEVLLLLGFNMNFAPVADVADNARREFSNGLYSRCFGNSKDETSELAAAYLRALQDGGCLGCVKHFPGLGASRADSHEELPVVDISEDELFDEDLFPYRQLLKTGNVHAVMIAHAVYPQTDLQETGADNKFLPSSLSFNFVTKLLRERLNFGGVIISDDLEMGAILKNYGIAEACKMAIDAGEDMLEICADAENVRKGFYALLDAVKGGEISENRIDQSLRRIAHLKSLANQPLAFSQSRLDSLSKEIAELNNSLN